MPCPARRSFISANRRAKARLPCCLCWNVIVLVVVAHLVFNNLGLRFWNPQRCVIMLLIRRRLIIVQAGYTSRAFWAKTVALLEDHHVMFSDHQRRGRLVMADGEVCLRISSSRSRSPGASQLCNGTPWLLCVRIFANCAMVVASLALSGLYRTLLRSVCHHVCAWVIT